MNIKQDQFTKNYADWTEFCMKMSSSYIKNLEKFDTLPIFDVYKSWIDAAHKSLEDPNKLQDEQVKIITNYIRIWENAYLRYVSETKDAPLYAPDPRDRRFKDTTWDTDFTFDFIRQSYLFTTEWVNSHIANIQGLDTKSKGKLDFYTKQFLDAISPSNFAFTNPEVIRETMATKGENLIKGFRHLLEDLEQNQITTAANQKFTLGKNLAITKGSVIYRNDLIELIQYDPVCKKTSEHPLLIIPAWINKYYILDLSPENSFVKYAVSQGYTVFMISWVNPTAELADKKFEDYMSEGILSSLTAIEQATGISEVNACGYCIGGTLLVSTMAYLEAKNDNRIKSATLLTTMVDFKDAGELCLFIDEEHLQHIDEQMQKHGVLEGESMAAIFSVLRANDLIWSFVINNYLMGREPFPFDILYWNTDSTNLPAKTHSFYLRNMYLTNSLAKKGGITLNGIRIDVGSITAPIYALSTQEDHIAPWQVTYRTTQMVKGKVKFVLAASGHVAGVINPPQKNKYYYLTNSQTPANPEKWLNDAEKISGSWWNDWSNWLQGASGKKIISPKVGKGKLEPLIKAPGKFVRG